MSSEDQAGGATAAHFRRLDPQARRLLERAAAANLPPLHTLSIMDARLQHQESRRRLEGEKVAVHVVQDVVAQTAAGAVRLRIYRPDPTLHSGPPPCLVYLHGGGWTLGDLDSHDHVARRLALYSRCVVISVDYRLAPEHQFPAAIDDAIAATRWVAANAHALDVDPDRLAVGGDSAGGNLAAATAIALRGSEVSLAYQLLLYPSTDMSFDFPSHRRLAEGYLLTRPAMLWFRANYLRAAADRDDWRASPLRCPELAGLPTTYVMTAGFDPLLDEGRAYAERLMAAGVDVGYECFEGMVHGFVGMTGVLAAGGHALHRCGHLLQAAFGMTSSDLPIWSRGSA